MRKYLILITIIGTLFVADCYAQKESASGNHPVNFTGTWRVYSERLFYDAGGAGSLLSASGGNSLSQTLVIKKDGSFQFGTSHGIWSVEGIKSSDWTEWRVRAYNPTRKIVLQGWNKGTASGPVEETGDRVDFVWVLYSVKAPLVSRPGIVNIKFGH